MLSLSSTYLLFTNEVKVLSGRLEKLQVNQVDLLENNLLSWFHESLEKLRLKRLKWWNLISFYKTLPRNHFKKSFHFEESFYLYMRNPNDAGVAQPGTLINRVTTAIFWIMEGYWVATEFLKKCHLFIFLHIWLRSAKFIRYNLKLVSAIFYQIFIFSPNDSPLKTMKNVFFFI